MLSLDRRTGVVLLAAGRGERFGGDKLTALFRGRPLWTWAAQAAEAIDFSERIIVVKPDDVPGNRPGWTRIENPLAPRGMGGSIAAGVSAISFCERVIVMLADMPCVSSAHLYQLASADGAAYSRYRGNRPGCPAAFPKSAFEGLRGLAGNQGARRLYDEGDLLISPAGENELADVDTVRDLAALAR